MSQNELEPKLAQIMSDIAEVEGICAFDAAGALISGQTIEEKDVKTISKNAFNLIDKLNALGKAIGKGNATEITIGLEQGYAVVEIGDRFSIVAFVDADSKSQLALLSRTLKNLM